MKYFIIIVATNAAMALAQTASPFASQSSTTKTASFSIDAVQCLSAGVKLKDGLGELDPQCIYIDKKVNALLLSANVKNRPFVAYDIEPEKILIKIDDTYTVEVATHTSGYRIRIKADRQALSALSLKQTQDLIRKAAQNPNFPKNMNVTYVDQSELVQTKPESPR